MAKLDPEARRFFDRLYEAARAGCVKGLRASGCSEEEAEEVFAGVLVDVIDDVDPIGRDFDPPQMVNYLKSSCRNRWISDRRHLGVLDVIDLEGAGPVGDARVKSLDEEAAMHETMDEIRRALRSLPARERDVFCRRHLQGLSPDEILRSTGLSRRTYRKLIQHANDEVRSRVEASEAA